MVEYQMQGSPCHSRRSTYVPAPELGRLGVRCGAARLAASWIHGECNLEGLARLCHSVCLPIAAHDLWQGGRAALPDQVQAEACRGNHCRQAAGSGRQRGGSGGGVRLAAGGGVGARRALAQSPLLLCAPGLWGGQPAMREREARHPHSTGLLRLRVWQTF